MIKSSKIVSSVAAAIMLSTIVTACSSTPSKTAIDKKEGNTDTQAKTATYPIKTDKTLTYWFEMDANLTGVYSSANDTAFSKSVQEKTGVKVKFINPPANQAKETLNVMLASGDLPDIIEYNYMSFPGGPEKAIKDGYILKLNDVIDKYAPNLKKYLQEHPEIDKMVKTDSGTYFAFPFIRSDEYLTVFQGPIVRKDWLNELGLTVPTTIDEWTVMLRAFKEKKGATAPFSMASKPRVFDFLTNGAFAGAYGVTRDFYIENGQIKFGPMEPGYKDFLSLFRNWYAEGLIDKSIATVDGKMLDANITSGATGATVANNGGGIGKWQPILGAKDKNAVLGGAPYPVLKKGETPRFGQKDYRATVTNNAAITANSKNVELAAKFLDYAYSDEGRMLYNFGTEGVSYKMENGNPKFTDEVVKNQKLSPMQGILSNARAAGAPFIQDKRYIEQLYALPTQREANDLWAKTDAAKYKLPPVTPTTEESAEFAKIMADVNTLVDEMTLKIILGEPLESFATYTQKMKSVKIDRALEIQKAALDRYNKR